MIYNELDITIDANVVNYYNDNYFKNHPRARKPPIKSPVCESFNTFIVKGRMAQNTLKQHWKDFIVSYMKDLGYDDLNIKECEVSFTTYYKNKNRHDIDNSMISPKLIFDGLVEANVLVDDDSTHVQKLTMQCGYDKYNPRTEIHIDIKGKGVVKE